MSLYKEIEKWYSDNGISLSQFREGSTEMYLDEMTHDFMLRSLSLIKELTTLKEQNKKLRECVENTIQSIDPDSLHYEYIYDRLTKCLEEIERMG